MATDHTGYELEIGGERYVARVVRGREAISTLFRLEVIATAPGTPPSVRGLIDSETTVHLVRSTSMGITEELRRIMSVTGCRTLAEIDESILVRRG